MKRTDLHRPGTIMPGDYRFVTSFAPPVVIDGECVEEGYGFDVVAEFMEAHAGATFGQTTKCGSCGARFSVGALFLHVATNEALFVGRDCAATMHLFVDWSRADLAAKRAAEGKKVSATRERNRTRYVEFCALHAGLAAALEREHRILRDLRGKLLQYGSLSEKQIAFVHKLASELDNPQPEELHVAAPTGRVRFTGEIVSIKEHENDFGFTCKATIKVTTPGGSWLAWVTIPQCSDWHKGKIVDLTATLTQGSSSHFAFGKRPIDHTVELVTP